jgi:hypothetical protein
VQKNDEGTKAGLDNRRAVEVHSLRGLLEEDEGVDRILAAIAAGNERGGNRAAAPDGRGCWEKESFLGQLEISARINGTWIDNLLTIADEAISRGQENEVYASPDGKNVVKLNNLSLLDENHNFGSFVDRLCSHNHLFPNVTYRIIGFAENSLGEVCVALKQPYVRNAKEATWGQIKSGLTDIGFRYTRLPDGEMGWTNGEYELWDAEPRNVLLDFKDRFYFIDTVVNSVAKPARDLTSGKPLDLLSRLNNLK